MKKSQQPYFRAYVSSKSSKTFINLQYWTFIKYCSLSTPSWHFLNICTGKCRVLLHMILPGLLNLTRRFNPVLYVHQPRFELTYGPPKSAKVPIVPMKHIGETKVLDRTYPAVIREADMVLLQRSANYPVPWKVLLQLFYPWRAMARSPGARSAVDGRRLEFRRRKKQKQKKKTSVKTVMRREDHVSSSSLQRIPLTESEQDRGCQRQKER